ncbi:MAG TPA: S8 family serine peptidase [Vicinamibacterales bacterium]|nr:S8 family serine peptidase [Vicinamibacterales bacterium]
MSLEAAVTLTAQPGRTGRGVRIAIVDSGVHVPHPHLGGVAGGTAFDDDGREHNDFIDRLGHGTAVAAAIHEKAPDAVLLAAKVFDRTLAATGFALAAAIRWAIGQRVHIINLSLGTANADHRARLEDVVGGASEAGITIVAAAPDEQHAWLPGSIPGVVAVELDWACPRDTCHMSHDPRGQMRVRASGYPRPIPGVPPERNLRGVSFAVANATGLLAQAMEADLAKTDQ